MKRLWYGIRPFVLWTLSLLTLRFILGPRVLVAIIVVGGCGWVFGELVIVPVVIARLADYDNQRRYTASDRGQA